MDQVQFAQALTGQMTPVDFLEFQIKLREAYIGARAAELRGELELLTRTDFAAGGVPNGKTGTPSQPPAKKPLAKPPSARAALAARKQQGTYMGLLRALTPAQKRTAKALYKHKGAAVAIREALKLRAANRKQK